MKKLRQWLADRRDRRLREKLVMRLGVSAFWSTGPRGISESIAPFEIYIKQATSRRDRRLRIRLVTSEKKPWSAEVAEAEREYILLGVEAFSDFDKVT